ncbi:MAG TPA: universal stress protein [Solirubrobacteraceae bacterium]|nr:universal stress protein [Solirubrobacteraceae bacterium]
MTQSPLDPLSESAAAVKDDVVFADILCAVDGTRTSSAAVEQAAALAGPAGRLTLLAVTAVEGAGAFRNAAISPARAEHLLDHAAEIAADVGVSSTQVVDPASPAAQVILDRAADHDLLAIGAPVTSWLGGMFIGGVAETALGSFTTPLLVAHPTRPGIDFARRMIIASDGLDGSDELVELAARLAHSRQASVVLVHAVGVESYSSPHAIQAQQHRLELALDGEVETQIVAESAHDAIVEAAKATAASLIVMGSRRLEGLRALGSVSRRVVHEAHCSVLLLPPQADKH